MEVVNPAPQFGSKCTHRFTDIPASGHSQQCIDIAFKALHAFISYLEPDVESPTTHRVAKEAALPWPVGGTFLVVDLKLQALFKKLSR